MSSNVYNFCNVRELIGQKEFEKAVIKLYTDKTFYADCVKGAKKLTEAINWENEFHQFIAWLTKQCESTVNYEIGDGLC